MGVEVTGLADTFEALDKLEDDYSGPVEDYVVGTPVEYAPPLEFGSVPHEITPTDAEALRFEIDGEIVFSQSVDHPGNDPIPFFRPAVNEVRLQGVDGFIRHNTRKDIEDIDSTRELLQTLAFALEGRIKEIITQKGLVDTGNLRASVSAVPISDISELRES